MKINYFRVLILLNAIAIISGITSCSKSDPAAGSTPPVTDPCAGKTITITATPTASSACNSTGSITAIAEGSTGFSYKLNSGGTYQAARTFNNLAAGTYTVFAKDGAGCVQSAAVTVTSDAGGPLFTEVKNLMATRCQSCHNNTVQNGGMNWTVDCNIVANKNRIKIRAVDEGSMPPGNPLSQAEKNIISNWVNAGGRITD